MFKILSRNCWFCDSKNQVSLFSSNDWFCNQCSQYNGFNQDGDYNKVIPEMFVNLNENKSSSSYSSNRTNYKSSNCLCAKCNVNEETKLKKIREFKPKNDSTYEIEIKFYKEQLERIYGLCDKCKQKVNFEIRKQDGHLKEYLYKLGNYNYLFENKKIKPQNRFKLIKHQQKWSKIMNFMNIFQFLLIIFSISTQYYSKWIHFRPELALIMSIYILNFVKMCFGGVNFTNVLLYGLTISNLYSNYHFPRAKSNLIYFLYLFTLLLNLIYDYKKYKNVKTPFLVQRNRDSYSNLSTISNSSSGYSSLIQQFDDNSMEIDDFDSSSTIISGMTNLYLDRQSKNQYARSLAGMTCISNRSTTCCDNNYSSNSSINGSKYLYQLLIINKSYFFGLLKKES